MATIEARSTEHWSQRPWFVIAALLVFFPVGLIVLFRSGWPRRWKIPLAFLFAAVFLVEVYGALIMLGIYLVELTFSGAVTPRFEFFTESRPDEIVAEHRAAQRREPHAPFAPRPVTDPNVEWPGYRGAYRDGVVRGGLLALPWSSEGPKLRWRQPVGGGFGSFAIYAGRAFTVEQRGADEIVACYAVDDGRELWTNAYSAQFSERLGGPGPRATPTFADERVYSLGGTGVLNCLAVDSGEAIWTRNILEDASAKNLPWGMCGSPLVDEGRVIVAPGGSDASVIAYDAQTGEPVWQSGSHPAAYSSPMLVQLLGRPQLLVFDGDGLSAYAPSDGTPLWHFPWKTDHGVNAGQPVVVDDQRVFISSGYGRGCAMIAIEEKEGDLAAKQLWSTKSLNLKFSSAVLHGGFIYGLDDNILVCIDVENGERRWKGGRYGYGQVILADGHLIVQCDDGDLALVEATPEAHREVSRVDTLQGKTWNNPALAASFLLVRNEREMACFDLTGQ